tara:strand:+ start:11729 stop:13210 length:1482 start_codon:yes stop_codon:yes gene_type:complete
MAEEQNKVDIFNRSLFGGFGPDEYKQAVDYVKQFQGIEPLDVNRGVTAEDVLRATGPLGQPVSPGLTNSVVQFNQFLGNILGAKSSRIAEEEKKISDQDAAARAIVDAELSKEEDEADNYQVVDGRLIDLRLIGSEGNPEGIVVNAKPEQVNVKNIPLGIFNELDEAEKDRILGLEDPEQTIKGVPMSYFLNELNQDQQNKILGLGSNETFQETFTTKDNKLGIIYLDSTGNIKTKIIEDAVGTSGGKSDKLTILDEITDLEIKKADPNQEFTDEDQIRLDILKDSQKQIKPYESSDEKLWAQTSSDLILAAPAKRDKLFKVNQVSQKLQGDFNTGILTPKVTVLQEILAPFGINLKGVLDMANINILNEASDSALIDALATQFGIDASDALAGQISERELEALFNTTIRLGAPEEFNEQFAIGLTYLLQKDLAASEIAADPNINSVKEWSVGMQQWMSDNPPPQMFSDVYNYNYLEDLNLDLNLRPLVDEES